MQDATKDAVQAIERIGRTIGAHQRDRDRDRVGGRGAGRGDAGDRPQRAGSRTRHGPGRQQHRGVNQAAEKTGSASHDVLASADQLSKQAVNLRADVDSPSVISARRNRPHSSPDGVSSATRCSMLGNLEFLTSF